MIGKITSEKKIILFFISPILALIASMKSMHTKSSRLVLFLFILFFGFSMLYDGSLRNDGLFHAVEFQGFKRYTFDDWLRQVSSFFDSDNPEHVKDIYDITIKYLISRFTDNYHCFFFAISILYAFFTVKFFKLFGDIQKFTWSIPWVILLYIFWDPQPVNINGVRFGTASVIAVYSIFKIFVHKDKRYFLLIGVTPLIHATFVFVYGMLALIFLTRRFEKCWIVLLFLSFVFSELSLQILRDSSLLIQSPFLAGWVDNYITEETYASKASGFYWLAPIFNFLSRVFMLGMLIIMIKYKVVVINDKRTKDLYMLSIIWYSVSNFAFAVPSLGERFIHISFPFIAYVWAIHFLNTGYKKYLYLFPLCNLTILKVKMDIYMSLFEPTFLISPIINFVKYTAEYIPASIPPGFI